MPGPVLVLMPLADDPGYLVVVLLNWVDWFNTTRLHSAPRYMPPIEFETEYYHHINPQQQPLPGELTLH
jgi:transposase InsO family protein